MRAPNVITRNTYLKNAVDHFYENMLIESRILLIDIDAQLTLRDLQRLINKQLHNETRNVVFTGAPGIYSGFFNNLDWINIGLPTAKFIERLSNTNGITINLLQRRIKIYLSLNALSLNQIKIALLSTRFGVDAIARILDISDKNIYSMLYIIQQKMNFHSFNHLRYFMIREFGGAQ